MSNANFSLRIFRRFFFYYSIKKTCFTAEWYMGCVLSFDLTFLYHITLLIVTQWFVSLSVSI